MKYMGSKNRIAKHILPIMLKSRGSRVWVEPFVGGANMIDKVKDERIGADFNPYLIEALKLIRDNPESLPDHVTEEDYKNAKDAKLNSALTGYIAFAFSFGAKWFGGYRRDIAGSKGCIKNELTQSRRSKSDALNQSINLKGVSFIHSSYKDLHIPSNSLIYCDPPYQNTTGYKDAFNHSEFWQWCRDKHNEGHRVFVSEYNAPEDFECVWSMSISTTLNKSKKDTEKLFTYNELF